MTQQEGRHRANPTFTPRQAERIEAWAARLGYEDMTFTEKVRLAALHAAKAERRDGAREAGERNE